MAKDGSYRICELKLNEIKVGTDSVERYFVGILVCFPMEPPPFIPPQQRTLPSA
jgi:hypothetical protein